MQPSFDKWWPVRAGGVIFSTINDPGMGRFQLLNLVGYR